MKPFLGGANSGTEASYVALYKRKRKNIFFGYQTKNCAKCRLDNIVRISYLKSEYEKGFSEKRPPFFYHTHTYTEGGREGEGKCFLSAGSFPPPLPPWIGQ